MHQRSSLHPEEHLATALKLGEMQSSIHWQLLWKLRPYLKTLERKLCSWEEKHTWSQSPFLFLFQKLKILVTCLILAQKLHTFGLKHEITCSLHEENERDKIYCHFGEVKA